MDCEWAVICDHALLSHDGKVSVIGIHDMVTLPAFPATAPVLFAVFRLRGTPNSSHQLRLELVAPGGEAIEHLAGEAWLGSTGVHTLMLALDDLTFPTPGRYSVRLSAGDRVIKSMALRMVLVVAGAPPPPAPTTGTIH
jgi:hypothetical protein